MSVVKLNPKCWHMPVVLYFGKWKQRMRKVEVILSYIDFEASFHTSDPVSKLKEEKCV